MAALVWDKQSQAWKESETPMVYDTKSGAFAEAAGLVWDKEAEAWVEAWGGKRIIYSYGRNADNFSKSCSYGTFTFEKNSDHLYTRGSYMSSSNWNGGGILDNVLHDINQYSKLYWRVDEILSGRSGNQIGFAKEGTFGGGKNFHAYNAFKWFCFYTDAYNSEVHENNKYAQQKIQLVEDGLYVCDLEKMRAYAPELFTEDGWHIGIDSAGCGGEAIARTYEIWLE